MHDARAGKTQRLTGEAFQARPQREVRAFDLLHHQLPHRVLRGRKMPLIDSCLVRVIPSDTKGGGKASSFRNVASFRAPTTYASTLPCDSPSHATATMPSLWYRRNSTFHLCVTDCESSTLNTMVFPYSARPSLPVLLACKSRARETKASNCIVSHNRAEVWMPGEHSR